MSIMFEMNEKSKEGWNTAHFAGHSESHDLHRITVADGITTERTIETKYKNEPKKTQPNTIYRKKLNIT
jgi:hypothetical protein